MLQKKKRSILILFTFFIFAIFTFIYAQALAPDMAGPISGESGMTLRQVIIAGGEVMVLLGVISLFALALVVHYYLTIRPNAMLPSDFSERVLELVDNGRSAEAKLLCESNKNLLSEVYLAGLSQPERDKYIIKERIEDQARRQVEGLWQKLSYLSDVAAISPMIGLLGTVLGMIQAFNVIAFQTGAVKPILLADGISKAMVTTAAGLAIAIPAMIFHSFFRSRAYDVERRLEDKATEFWHLISERKNK